MSNKESKLSTFHSIRRAVLSHWLLSYCLILIIPFIAFGFYYTQTMVMIDNANYNVCKQELTNVKQSMDATLSQMQSTALQLSADEQIRTFASKTQVTNYEHYLFGRITWKLQTYINTDTRYLDIGVFKTDLDLLLTHSKITTISADGLSILGNDVIARAMDGQLLNHFFVNPNNDTLVFVHTVDRTWRMDGRVKSYLYVVLDKSVWQNITANISDFSSLSVYAYDDLMIQSKVPLTEAKLILTLDSDVNGIEYKMFFADSGIFSRIEFLRRMSTILIIATLLVCSTLLIYFIRKNYKPIRKLVEQTSTAGYKRENEFIQIEQGISSLKENNSLLELELSKQTQRSEEASLIRLINGIENDSDINSLYRTPFFSQEALGCYTLISLGIVNTQDQAEISLPIDEVSLFSRLESFMKMINCPSENYRILYINDLATLILRLQEPNLQATLEQICLNFTDMMNTMHTPVCLGISSSSTDIHQLRIMAYEAKEAYEYCVMYNVSYLYYQQLPTMLVNDKSDRTIPMRDVHWKFSERIEALQFIQASELIGDLLPDGLPLHIARLNIYTVINLYRVSLSKLGTHIPWICDIAECMVSTLLECSNSLPILRTKLNEFLCELNERTKEDVGLKHANTVQGIMDYIQTNYSNPQLSVNLLADQFEMSPSAISRMFSSKTGRGLLDYIHCVRTDKAKELLKENKYAVSEIYEMVGYLSASTFIRVFKKYVGISPGNYATTHAEQSQTQI